jgi:uncharacterized membrane protein YfcA
MPEGLIAVLTLPGLEWLLAVTLLAGVVYGFAAFGSALIFMPLATLILEPTLAVAAFAISALSSLITVVPAAWKIADRSAVVILLLAAFVTMPLGIFVLRSWDVTVIQLMVSVVVFITLGALMLGWRYHTIPSTRTRIAVGAATGIVGGATGLMGPIVILFNLGSGASVSITRANTLVFLTLISLLMLPQMALQGVLSRPAIWLGLIMLVPYGLGTLVGRRFFNPEFELVYRRTAYAIIALAAIVGLPIWE